MQILHPCYFGLRRLPSLHGTPAATHRACARTNLPDLRFTVGGLRLSCGADLGGLPAAPSMLRSASPPQPRTDAKGVAVPERKIGFEALEASAKLRKSSIDCLSGASFEATRSEQLRLPAEGPLKRRDASSSKSTLHPLPGRSRLTDPHFLHCSRYRVDTHFPRW